MVDVELRYALTSKVNLAFGADNVFDEYPESVPTTLNTTGNTPYPNYAPFGRGGRFVYARVVVRLLRSAILMV
ncbi:TonB-dependent receptor [Massilia sp. B-10]|nr:TonB-dependent receptor [Massilia sp. B-10]